MPAQKEQRSPADQVRAQDDDGTAEAEADTVESGEAGASVVRLTHAEQQALRSRLRAKFH